MSSIKKHPEKLRITLKEQSFYECDPVGNYIHDAAGNYIKGYGPPLGFANAYEPHLKAYEKRAQTQDAWAYGDCFVDAAGRMVANNGRWERNSDPTSAERHIFIKEEKLVNKELQPIIIDNVPISGFRIQKSVSRWSTSNKVWRILDPRGFELEISTDCMEDILMEGDVSKGEIIGQCVWRTAKILVRV